MWHREIKRIIILFLFGPTQYCLSMWMTGSFEGVNNRQQKKIWSMSCDSNDEIGEFKWEASETSPLELGRIGRDCKSLLGSKCGWCDNYCKMLQRLWGFSLFCTIGGFIFSGNSSKQIRFNIAFSSEIINLKENVVSNGNWHPESSEKQKRDQYSPFHVHRLKRPCKTCLYI